MKKLILLFFIVLSFTFSNSRAQDFNFATTKDEIIDALINTEIKQRSETRTTMGSIIPKTRGLKIVTGKEGEIVEKKIDLHETESEQGVNLNIKFDFYSYAIRPESFVLINELGKALIDEKVKIKNIIIKGHTDSTGIETYNLKLSLKRALAVKTYLTENFTVASSRIKVVGCGETLPLVSNSNEANRQINRRVEVVAE